jgi:hypothetical protein
MVRWKLVVSSGLDTFSSGQTTVVGSCEHGNEPSGSAKSGNFLTNQVTVGLSRTLLQGVG